MSARLDHLVVAARTLEEGVAWCESTLGITPGLGGRHGLMGTHNRLFSIASAAMPLAYFEIIAVDPDANDPGRARWYDLDAPEMRGLLSRGPQLIHWVLACDDIEARCERLRATGIDRGDAIAAQRQTPAGLLEWRISVRADGARLFDGALPTFIQWGEDHPADTMPPSGVTLDRLEVAGLPAVMATECVVPGGVFGNLEVPLCACLTTPRGQVVLRSASSRGEHVQS